MVNIWVSGKKKYENDKVTCAFQDSFCKLTQMRNTNLEHNQNNVGNIYLANKIQTNRKPLLSLSRLLLL